MAKDQIPIAKRLKYARLTRGISQKSLGISIGIDEFVASARMNQYEKGVHVPAYQTVNALAKYLKFPVAYFYESNDDIAELLSLVGSLNKKQIKAFIEAVKQKILLDKC